MAHKTKTNKNKNKKQTKNTLHNICWTPPLTEYTYIIEKILNLLVLAKKQLQKVCQRFAFLLVVQINVIFTDNVRIYNGIFTKFNTVIEYMYIY